MASQSKDRLAALETSSVLNGIDFVEVATDDQCTLVVHFINKVGVKGTVLAGTGGSPPAASITGGESIPTVAVNPIDEATDWSTDADGYPLLTLGVDAPGDFSFYTLSLNSNILDDYFKQKIFSFKSRCPSTLDCAAPSPPCPEESGDLPPIDYLAKDFLSLRQALSDFSALRYPEWQERSEADFGVMFMEALCAMADDLSYFQDRVAAESTLDTATQRRSVVRHARLVDYEPAPATSARTMVQVNVAAGVTSLDAGRYSLYAQTPDGVRRAFEVGEGLIDPATGLPLVTSYTVNPLWNRADPGSSGIQPYWWDDSQRCLQAGATSLWVQGSHPEFFDGQKLLIETDGATTADPPIREIVRLKVEGTPYETVDQLFGDAQVTLLEWYPDTALTRDHDLTRTTVAGNLVPAIQGARWLEGFAIPPGDTSVETAIHRTGPNGTSQYLYSLQQPNLSWLTSDTSDSSPLPEIVLTQSPTAAPPFDWTWRRSLLDAELFETAYTLDPVSYVRISGANVAYTMYEYDGDGGYSIRFGDGVFGTVPQDGENFQVLYRTGDGSAGNVPADAITGIDQSSEGVILAVTNPFAAAGGSDAQTNDQVRRLAPQAFRAMQYRAVRSGDYRNAAESLPWVLRAGAAFRWTGSWLTGSVTADPMGSDQITVEQQLELIRLIDRYRMAGYEVYAPPPRYVGLDLQMQVYAQPDAFRSQVEAAILTALSATKLPGGASGFFYFDRFTFGTPLERSALEAAVQGCPGVGGVLSVLYRRRGLTPAYIDMPDSVEVGRDEIIRVDNDPNYPERGSIKVSVGGGK
jgi:hypothetical protein